MPPLAIAGAALAGGSAILGGEAAKQQHQAAIQATEDAQRELRDAQEGVDRATAQGQSAIRQGTDQASRQSLESYYSARGDINAGTDRAAGNLDRLAGMGPVGVYDVTGQRNRAGELFDQGTGFDFEADPGYQFRKEQGEQAIERATAARGGRSSGRFAKELTQFNSGLAAQEYGNAFQRNQQNLATRLGQAQSADALTQAYMLNQAGRSDQAALTAQGLNAQGLQGIAGLYAGQGQQLAGLGMQTGNQLAQLYANQGQQLAGLGMQGAGMNANLAGGIANAYMAPVQYAGGEAAAYANSGQQFLQMGTNLLGQAGGAAASALSDARAKTRVADADDEVADFLDSIAPYGFEYVGEEGTRYGVMAQEVERTPAGASTVHEVHGLKHIDLRKALMLALASVAHLNKRVRELEAGA